MLFDYSFSLFSLSTFNDFFRNKMLILTNFITLPPLIYTENEKKKNLEKRKKKSIKTENV